MTKKAKRRSTKPAATTTKTAGWPCVDCGAGTVLSKRGCNEDYMVHDEVWEAAGMPPSTIMAYGGNGDFLCVGCLEVRLGRRLTPADFTKVPINNPTPWDTPRLASRKATA
jgi:hypothetical protein